MSTEGKKNEEDMDDETEIKSEKTQAKVTPQKDDKKASKDKIQPKKAPEPKTKDTEAIF